MPSLSSFKATSSSSDTGLPSWQASYIDPYSYTEQYTNSNSNTYSYTEQYTSPWNWYGVA
jgi:hypothetical protein